MYRKKTPTKLIQFGYIILIVSFWSLSLLAQKDSLTLLYEKATASTTKYEVLKKLSINNIKKFIYTQEAKTYAGLLGEEAKIRNDSSSIIIANQYLSRYYYNNRKFELATFHTKKAFETAENMGKTEAAGMAQYHSYLIYYEQKKFKEGYAAILEAQQKAMNCNSASLIALVNFGLSKQYYLLNDYETSIKYEKKSIQHFDKKGEILNSIGSSINVANSFLKLSKPDSAQYYLNRKIGAQSAKTFSELKGYAYNTQSRIDYQQENYELSIINAQKAIGAEFMIDDEVEGLINLAKAYAKINDSINTKICIKKAKEITQNNLSSLPVDVQKDLYTSFISLYKESDKKKALNYALKLNALENSIRQDKHSMQVAVLSVKNEVQLKELKNIQLRKEQVLKVKVIRNLQIGLIVLGILTSLILFSFWQIKQKNKAIHFKNNQLKKLNYTISHDGLIYVSNILSYANFSLESNAVEKSHSLTKQFYSIQRTATQLKKMMRNIVLSFKLDSKQDISTNKVVLDDIVQGVLDNLALNIKAVNATVQTDRLPIVQANREMMIQLFQNLISNALKYRKENVRPELHISHQSTDTHHQIIIEDNGIGIPKEKLSFIFNPFSQVSQMQNQGFGLGLSICQQIAEWHKGEMFVESAVNQGSRFYFTLLKTA